MSLRNPAAQDALAGSVNHKLYKEPTAGRGYPRGVARVLLRSHLHLNEKNRAQEANGKNYLALSSDESVAPYIESEVHKPVGHFPARPSLLPS